MASPPKYVKAVEYFRRIQKTYGYKEVTNIIQNKWNMRSVMEDIDNDAHVRQLIQFFLMYSDDKSFQCFFDQYDKYYQTMLDVKRDRALRKHLREQTILKKRDEETGGS